MSRIVAIAVTYNPAANLFAALLQRLLSQVALVIVVDNTSTYENPALELALRSAGDRNRCRIVRLKTNLGIAHGINVGLSMAVAEGAEFVLLSDQDSLPANDMVEKLYLAYSALLDQGFKVGAVGPTFTDVHNSHTFSFQAKVPGKFFYGHISGTNEVPHVEALSLITSGTLIPIRVIKDVGLMREDFFIDEVDIEWCHRARAKGYKLFGTAWATMCQQLGEAQLRVWYFGWRKEIEYSPLRTYYRLRNLVALWKTNFIDWRWKVRKSWYGLGVVYSHVFFAKSKRYRHFVMAVKGVWHGVVNRMGPFEEG